MKHRGYKRFHFNTRGSIPAKRLELQARQKYLLSVRAKIDGELGRIQEGLLGIEAVVRAYGPAVERLPTETRRRPQVLPHGLMTQLVLQALSDGHTTSYEIRGALSGRIGIRTPLQAKNRITATLSHVRKKHWIGLDSGQLSTDGSQEYCRYSLTESGRDRLRLLQEKRKEET